MRRPETRNVDAHDALLRGFFHLERVRREENLEARRWFEQAFTLDPDFASAHAMYGITYSVEYIFGWNRDPAVLEVAEEAARRALDIGTRTADPWNVLAGVFLARGEYEAAITAAERAIAAEPSHDVPHGIRAIALAAQGQLLPALASVRRSLRLNPKGNASQQLIVALVNYRAGRIADAVARLEEARAENPDLVMPRLALIFHRDSEGRRDEVRAIVGEILRINPDLTAAEADQMLLVFEAADDVFRRAGLP